MSGFDKPLFQYDDHDEHFAMFTIATELAPNGDTIARIEAGGKTFEARHYARSQAIADVEAAVDAARKVGTITPGLF